MDTENEKNPALKSEASMLATKAWMEKNNYGKVNTKCPRCHKTIEVFQDEYRIIVSCPCRYVGLCEIVF